LKVAQVGQLASTMPAKKAGPAKKDADVEKARRACKDFEAILLYHLLSSMRSAFQSEEELDSGLGGDIFRSMIDEQLSLALARGGGIGLASMLEKGLGLHKAAAKLAPESGLQKLGPGPATSHAKPIKLTGGVDGNPAAGRGSVEGSSPDRPYDQALPAAVPQASVGQDDSQAAQIAPGTLSSAPVSAQRSPDNIRRYEPAIRAAATVFGLSKDLIKAVIMQESGGNPRAISSKGAKGLMQLTDGTAMDLGVSNPFDPVQNIFGGARFLAGLLKRFGGDIELALASYNAGIGAVLKYGGIPPFKETQNYVRQIVASLGGRISPVNDKG
jgi:soluble lytic murein transglycosylase-like protein